MSLRILLICLACCVYAMQDKTLKMITLICEFYSSPSTDNNTQQLYTEKVSLLKLGYCMTYGEGSGFHIDINFVTAYSVQLIQPWMNTIISDFPTMFLILMTSYNMCGPMNREGPMCSVQMTLVFFSIGHPSTKSNSAGVWYGVPLYLSMEFVPIIIFYFIVMFFHINLTSVPMVAFDIFFTVRLLFRHSPLWFNLVRDSSLIQLSFTIFSISWYNFRVMKLCVCQSKKLVVWKVTKSLSL